MRLRILSRLQATRQTIWKYLLGLIAAVAVSALALSLGSGTPDPVFQGKPLSEWLAGYTLVSGGYFSVPDPGPANEAVRSLGERAIPLLLRELRVPDSRIAPCFHALLSKAG